MVKISEILHICVFDPVDDTVASARINRVVDPE